MATRRINHRLNRIKLSYPFAGDAIVPCRVARSRSGGRFQEDSARGTKGTQGGVGPLASYFLRYGRGREQMAGELRRRDCCSC